MTARLHLIEQPDQIPWDDAGAMWRVPDYDHLPGDESYCIVLPNRAGIWITTQPASMPGTNERGERWTVTGTPPNITVTPSINAGDGPDPGNWHGFITDGEMSP